MSIPSQHIGEKDKIPIIFHRSKQYFWDGRHLSRFWFKSRNCLRASGRTPKTRTRGMFALAKRNAASIGLPSSLIGEDLSNPDKGK